MGDGLSYFTILSETKLTCPDKQICARDLHPGSYLLAGSDTSRATPVVQSVRESHITESVDLYGINGEGCFFTGTQVFLTSTGLRAIKPTIAQAALGGVEVGQLQIGHVLYRLNHTRTSHELVIVQSIETFHGESTLSMVAFEDGPSTFYANDFLIMSMQPHKRIVSTAQALLKLSEGEQMRCLRQSHEVESQVALLGSHGISQVLHRELADLTTGSGTMLLHSERCRPSPSTFNILEAKRSYALELFNGDSLPKISFPYSLPRISLFEGVLRIDGKVELNATIHKEEGKVQWSRQLSDRLFEHGDINMFDHAFAGSGVIVINSLASDASVTAEAGAQYARVKARKDTTQASQRKGVLSRLGDSHEDQYQMIVDRVVWPKAELDRKTPKDPVQFGTLTFDTMNIGGQEGIELPVVKLPVLDELFAAMNAIDNTEISINALYSSAMTMTDRSDLVVNVKLDRADLIAALADPFSLENPFGLTFHQTLKSDLILPVLFAEFSLKLVENRLVGTMYEYNPQMRGCMGQRHLFISSQQQHEETVRMRLENHESIGTLSPALTSTSSGTPFAASSMPLAGLCVQDLLSLSKYSEPAVHDASQQLINNAMLYHMDDDDRKVLLQITDKPVVPKDLPRELGDGLDSKTKTWLRNIYAPAVVATQLNRMDPTVTSSWRYNFTSQEKMRLNYFWTGKGKSCLSKQKEYSDLTEIASRCAMERLWPRIKYYQQRGSEWGAKLIDCVTDPAYLRSMRFSPIEGASNHNNKVQNILSAIDINGRHSNDLAVGVLSNTVVEAFNAPVIGQDAAVVDSATKTFMLDTWKTMVRQTLSDNGKSEWDLSVKQDLISEVVAIENLAGLDSSASVDQRVDAIMAYQTPFLNQLCVYANESPVPRKHTKEHNPSVPEINAQLQASGGWDWARIKVIDAPQSSALDANAKILSGLVPSMMTIAFTCYLLFKTATAIVDWSTMSTTSKATLTTRILSAIVTTIYYAPKAWIALINFRPSTIELARISYMRYVFGLDIAFKRGVLALKESFIFLVQKCQVKLCLLRAAIPKAAVTFMEGIAESIANAASKVVPGWTKVLFGRINLSDGAMNALGTFLNAVLVVTLSLQLREAWGNMNTFDKTMNIIQIGICGLGIFFSETVANMLIYFGLFAATDSVVAAIPVVGTVLAVIGAVLAGITMLVDWLIQRNKPVPLNPYETFIKDKSKPMMQQWLDQPPQRLKYEVPPSVFWTSGRSRLPTAFTIVASNESNRMVRLSDITITVTCGSTKKALFSNTSFEVVERTNIRRDADGHVFLGKGDNIQVKMVKNVLATETLTFDLQVVGIPSDNDTSGYVQLYPGRVISLTVVGTLADVDMASIQVVENLVDPADTVYQFSQVKGEKMV